MYLSVPPALEGGAGVLLCYTVNLISGLSCLNSDSFVRVVEGQAGAWGESSCYNRITDFDCRNCRLYRIG